MKPIFPTVVNVSDWYMEKTMFLMFMIVCARNPEDNPNMSDPEKYALWLENEKTTTTAYRKPKNIRDWSHQNWDSDCTQTQLGIRIPQKSIQEVFRLNDYPNFGVLISSEKTVEKSVLFNLNPTNIHLLEQKSGGMILYDRGDIIFDLDAIRSNGFEGQCILMYGDNLEACIASQYELPITL